jgi:hypothetical protein
MFWLDDQKTQSTGTFGSDVNQCVIRSLDDAQLEKLTLACLNQHSEFSPSVAVDFRAANPQNTAEETLP